MENKAEISTDMAPVAIGPYSQAVRIGNMVFTSGQIPLDPATGSLVTGGIREQTVRVFENLKAVLSAANQDFRHVVKTTVFLTDMKDFAAMNEVYGEFFDWDEVVYPARSTVQVSALPRNALIEIDCIAKDLPTETHG